MRFSRFFRARSASAVLLRFRTFAFSVVVFSFLFSHAFAVSSLNASSNDFFELGSSPRKPTFSGALGIDELFLVEEERAEERVAEDGGVFARYLQSENDVTNDWKTSSALTEPYAPISPESFARVDSLSASSVYWNNEAIERGFEEDEDEGRTEGVFTPNAFSASHEMIVRGSVHLPSINSIQFWGNGYVGSGHIRPVNWDGRVLGNNSGAALGLNLPLGIATISAYYNYHRNRMVFAGRKVQQKDDGFGMALYTNVGGFYMTAAGCYGDDGYAACDLNGRYAGLNFGGRQATGFFETGYEMATLGMFVLKPFGSYQYTNLQHENFDTRTLRKLDGKKKYNSCLMTLGSRVILNLAGLDVCTMEGRMAWVTQLRKRNESIQSFCYGRVPGTFSMAQPYYKGTGAGSDFFWGGLGVRLSLLGALSVSADYDCLVNKYQTLNEGSISLLLGF